MESTSDTEVFFSSHDNLVPFKNPSDAAIARLSVQKEVTSAAVQAMLDLIVFNPSFNPREVTFKSAGSIDEVVAEYREARVSRRASGGGKEIVSGNGATSPLAIALIVSQIKQDMAPFFQALRAKRLIRDNKLLKTMSLVHRSWTMPAQELLFWRVVGTIKRGLVRPLLQHPYCSTIRELHLEVGDMSRDDMTLFALPLPQLASLRKLSLSIWMDEDSEVDRDNICAKIYPEISQRLPILTDLRMLISQLTLLEDCVGCILKGESGTAPFVLNDFLIADAKDFSGDELTTEMLLSSAKVHPIAHHEASYYPSSHSSPQTHNSGDISKCSVTVAFQDELNLVQFCQTLCRLFDTGGLFGSIHPQISHFAFYHYCYNTGDPQTPVDQFLVRFLERCTSLAHMSLFVPVSSSQEMSTVPFSSILKSLRVLSICYYCPVDAEAHERASGLERIVRTMHDRKAGSCLERIEVTFCPDPYSALRTQTMQTNSIETAPPKYLDPVHRLCRELDIDLVCKLIE